MKRMDNKPT